MVCCDDGQEEIPAWFIEESPVPRRPSPVMTTWRNEESLSHECKNLIQGLIKKIDALCAEYEQDMHIRSNLTSLLLTLQSMHTIMDELECTQNTQEHASPITDNQGLTYVAVRNCDLERFSVK
jgi:hypothetical protein